MRWFVFVCAVPAFCQGFHIGVKAGVPITQYFDTGASGSLHGGAEYSAATRRYTVGAAGEVDLTRRFDVEIDALYHRMGYVGIGRFFDSASGNFQNFALDVKGNSWDFPLLAKYRFGESVRPYVAAGGVLRYVGPVRGRGSETTGSLATGASTTVPIDTSDPSDLRKRWYPGLTAAGGVEIPIGRLRVSPEIRYTHWTANISGEGGVLRFAPDQVEFLVGLTF